MSINTITCSNLIKRSISSNICNMDIACEICTLSYNEDNRKPLSLPCGHSLCDYCLTEIKKESTKLTCPFDRKQFENNQYSINYAVLKLIAKVNIDDSDTCKSNPPSTSKIIVTIKDYTGKCPNKHLLKWTNNKYSCNKCNQINHGMNCGICGYHYCTKCINIVPITTKKCPSKHGLIWISSKHLCFNCNQITHGMHCEECGYHRCTTCWNSITLTTTNVKKCPNNHSIKWTSIKYPCITCDQVNHGLHCTDCEYHRCTICSNISLNNVKKCPNNHQLKWKSTIHQCNNCGQIGHGMHCDLCEYHYCSKAQCANISVIRTKKCPNNHTLKWKDARYICINCNQMNHGMHCDECQFHLCSKAQCANISVKNSKKCPNNHPLKWKSSRFICSNCYQINHGLHCTECGYHYCSRPQCSDISVTNSKKCPNNDPLKWTPSRYLCLNCGQTNHGMHCNDCGYHYCSQKQCANISIQNSKKCPNNDPLKWTSFKYFCHNCGQIKHGMHCLDCGYHFCSESTCANLSLSNVSQCPNKDMLMNTSKEAYCHHCKQIGNGKHCNDCGYHICSLCVGLLNNI